MRHLLSPLDFSTEELNELFYVASDIAANPGKYSKVRSLLLCSMSQAPVQGLVLKPQCLILEVLFLASQMPVQVQHPKEKVFLIQFVSFPVMQTYVQ